MFSGRHRSNERSCSPQQLALRRRRKRRNFIKAMVPHRQAQIVQLAFHRASERSALCPNIHFLQVVGRLAQSSSEMVHPARTNS